MPERFENMEAQYPGELDPFDLAQPFDIGQYAPTEKILNDMHKEGMSVVPVPYSTEFQIALLRHTINYNSMYRVGPYVPYGMIVYEDNGVYMDSMAVMMNNFRELAESSLMELSKREVKIIDFYHKLSGYFGPQTKINPQLDLPTKIDGIHRATVLTRHLFANPSHIELATSEFIEGLNILYKREGLPLIPGGNFIPHTNHW